MLLAIDTSTRHAGVALAQDTHILMAQSWVCRENHTKELLPAVHHVLEQQNINPSSIDAIAVAIGPGGFSSLRVGISVAKGLAWSLKAPLIGIETLEMEAYPYANLGLPVCPLLDMNRGELAAALFQKIGGDWTQLIPTRLYALSQIRRLLKKRTLICGEGVRIGAVELQESLGRKALIVDHYSPSLRLAALVQLATQRFQTGNWEGTNTTNIQPLYLRQPRITLPKPRPDKK